MPFGSDEVRLAARLYGASSGARGRELDLAIAACAISWDVRLWTVHRKDFAGVEGLELVD